ncbi:DHA1 family bicyclomycin/chloramphenicol resistance-like MFS transporter [Aliiruegeria haliotis]|uniref:DHA1 family bicyclomycin/chloramphenicol resistance-like MFS transporter n=1 Tax=Aliiruegeria haliotis TaxID=1280846 RepID=A0A2T0RYQ8_9RHOB|nr:multidrug effflux MFS transporter [Aliiruegeria haliotis]PRY26272.1 DHA1 family bicyclomycin/chloramphenicol resistance-like MFS transporter [Aliiruegeria haliotis]
MSEATANHSQPRAPLGQAEFIALMAMTFATVAFSIDAMLPALPDIAGEISAETPNRAQMIITSFVLGLGVGTLFTGPLSDAYGRKPVVMAGAALYVLGATLAWQAHSIETMFAARVLQGLGAAGPRVVAMAIIRDLYAGRKMARLMSFIMLIFTIVPAIAPTIGAGIIWAVGWRGIFPCFMLFSVIATSWMMLRQPETLRPENRRPFRPRPLLAGIREIVTHRVVALSLLTQSLTFGMLFSTLSSTQPIFDQTFGRGESFHLWFGAIALVSGTSGLINAALVERLGMRFLITATLGCQIVFTGIATLLVAVGGLPEIAVFGIYVLWTAGVFFQNGLTIGNLNALAMEPMGHLAGLTASVTGSVSTVAAVLVAIPLGLAFDGTPVPLMIGTLMLATVSYAAMLVLRWTDPPDLRR